MISRVATLGCWDARKDPRIVERVVLQNNFRSQSMLKRPSSTLDDLEVKRRPQTTWERIQNFPKGTKILYLDCLRYKSIHDASRTPLNAWTVKHPHRKRKDGESEFFIHKNERRPGRIPRRQYEQQRRLQNDIRIMAPLAAVCTIPFFGYIPLLLAITVPRQVLSHHFHNDHEYAMYARTEYRQRRNAYMDIGECFWPTMLINIKKTPIPQSEEDMAGPIFDGMIIYSAFTDDTNIVSSIPNLRMQQGSLSSINALPREYLVSELSQCLGSLARLLWTRPIEWQCNIIVCIDFSSFVPFLTGQVFSGSRHQPISPRLGEFMGRNIKPIVVAAK
jgi:hypothetical protein